MIAKLVQITPITMVYGTYNELVNGVYKLSRMIVWLRLSQFQATRSSCFLVESLCWQNPMISLLK